MNNLERMMDVKKSRAAKVLAAFMSLALALTMTNVSLFAGYAWADKDAEAQVENEAEAPTENATGGTETPTPTPEPDTVVAGDSTDADVDAPKGQVVEEATNVVKSLSEKEGGNTLGTQAEATENEVAPQAAVVDEQGVVEFDGQSGETLADVMNNPDVTTVKLVGDCASGEAITVKKAVVLDLNGHNLEVPYMAADGNGASLTIQGSGNLTCADATSGLRATDGGTLTINGGTITSSANPSRGLIEVSEGSKAEIGGGTISSNTRGVYTSGGTVTVSGGTIDSGTYGIRAEGGQVAISNGLIKGKSIGVLSTGATVTVSGGAAITGETGTGLYIRKQGKLTINNGEVTGGEYAVRCFSGSPMEMIDGSLRATGVYKEYNGQLVLTGYGIATVGANQITVRGGTITAPTFGIAGNGSDYEKSAINIYNGNIHGGTGIYHPQPGGNMTIYGGTITGESTGVEVRAGYVTIAGGEIVSTSDEFIGTANGNGATVTGAGVAVSQHITNQVTSVTIDGGTITGYHALYEDVYRNETDNKDDATKDIALQIIDGVFTGTHGDVVFSEHRNVFIAGGFFNQDLDSSDSMSKYLGTYGEDGAKHQFPSHETNLHDGYFHVHKPNITADGEYASNDTQHWQGCQADGCMENDRADHTFVDGDITKAPTCTEPGTQQLICGTCGKVSSNTKELPATGHAYGEWEVVIPATADAEGLEQRVCANDPSHVETRPIPMLATGGGTDGGAGTGAGTGGADDGVTDAPAGPDTTVIPDDATPLAAVPVADAPADETIADDGNPLASFELTPQCWVHWLMLIGIIVTAFYGIGVVVNRRKDSQTVDELEASLTGRYSAQRTGFHRSQEI